MHQMMNSKEAECPPIQMEPVDLSINKSRSSSPTLSISPELGRRQMSPPSPAESPNLIDLRMNRGDNVSFDEHSCVTMDTINRSGLLSLQRIKEASIWFHQPIL
ncbi:uncharacterized protein LOC143247856 isoform X2 [Tachypleus tridentatus]|uniref:uncharacterized protein LOC143247856 isoform X2 n=1 Tax=Tachypleus tridentatus TaxID=6853 RepID=UPI003FD1831C